MTSLPTTMKGYVLHEAGPASNLKLQTDLPVPSLEENEILIAPKAISINPVDFKCRSYEEVIDMIMMTEGKRPVILGWDVAGEVVKVGSGVTTHKVGDRVFGMIQFPGHAQAYADYIKAPQDHVVTMLESQTYEQAAAATLAALTALQALEHGKVQSGHSVLIHAGSGGVGHFAIQIAKAMGATKIITTSSAKNKDFCMQLGATDHVDYRSVKFEDVVKDVDFVLDGMGGETLERSLHVLKKGNGHIVTLPTPDFPDTVKEYAKENGLTAEFIIVKSSEKDMLTLRSFIEKGQVKPHVSKTFPFGEMIQAHEQLETGRTVGKVVVLKED